MVLTELDPVAGSVLPLAAFREHLRLGRGFADDQLQDTVLEAHLRAALAAVETRIGKALLERRFALDVQGWAGGGRQPLPLAPVRAIESIALIDAAGVSQPVDPARYRLVPDGRRPEVVATGGGLPAISRGGAARLVFAAGIGAGWADLPPDLRQAVLMMAAGFYEDRDGSRTGARGATGSGIAAGVEALLAAHLPLRVGLGGI